jgi:CRP-like cAMP-binding protein
VTVADNDVIVSSLAGTDLFAGLSPKTLRSIAESGEVRDFEAGTVVTTEGAKVEGFSAFGREGAYFHLILDGDAAVSRHGEAVATIGPGAYFGEVSLIDGGPRSAEVTAGASGLRTFSLQKWSFESLLEEHPEVAAPMLRVMTARLRSAEARGD